jgi:hypothetical protein
VRRTDAAETVDGNLDLGLGGGVDGGSLVCRGKERVSDRSMP